MLSESYTFFISLPPVLLYRKSLKVVGFSMLIFCQSGRCYYIKNQQLGAFFDNTVDQFKKHGLHAHVSSTPNANIDSGAILQVDDNNITHSPDPVHAMLDLDNFFRDILKGLIVYLEQVD